jgi:hypothetical protein
MSVYFITCREANAVKIGSSHDPHKRLREVQWGCPLEVALEGVWPGNREAEFELHRRFADDRLRGEWFTISPTLDDIIAAATVPPVPAKPAKRDPKALSPITEQLLARHAQRQALEVQA